MKAPARWREALEALALGGALLMVLWTGGCVGGIFVGNDGGESRSLVGDAADEAAAPAVVRFAAADMATPALDGAELDATPATTAVVAAHFGAFYARVGADCANDEAVVDRRPLRVGSDRADVLPSLEVPVGVQLCELGAVWAGAPAAAVTAAGWLSDGRPFRLDVALDGAVFRDVLPPLQLTAAGVDVRLHLDFAAWLRALPAPAALTDANGDGLIHIDDSENPGARAAVAAAVPDHASLEVRAP